MSTHTWGEDPKGTWTLEIENHGKNFGINTRFWETAPPTPPLSQHFALSEK